MRRSSPRSLVGLRMFNLRLQGFSIGKPSDPFSLATPCFWLWGASRSVADLIEVGAAGGQKHRQVVDSCCRAPRRHLLSTPNDVQVAQFSDFVAWCSLNLSPLIGQVHAGEAWSSAINDQSDMTS